MRLLPINFCTDCLYFDGDSCYHPEVAPKKENMSWYIPEWCPLPKADVCNFCGKKLDDSLLKCNDCQYAG
jgi:hypothetical protein